MFPLASIALAAPAMMAGAALAVLPLIAHWLNRGARHRIVFPSLRLLTATRADQARLHRPRRWILLLVRAAAVAMLALAFAQPVWRERDASGTAPDRPATVVLVADVSASTAQRSDGVPAMNALRAAAARILRELVSGLDRANLVVAGARAAARFPAPTANLPAVLAEVEGLAPSSARADLAGALAVAGRQLGAHDGPRHLVVLTDRQRSNWEDLETSAATLPSDVRITLVPVAGTVPENVALSAPALEPALPAAGQGATLVVRVANRGVMPATVPVTCTVGEGALAERPVTLAPGEAREVAFPVRFAAPGFHRVVVEIPDDGLPADNRVHLAATVVERSPVVVVGDDDPDQAGSASYFLVRALSPRGGAGDRLRARHLRGADVEAAQLADAAGVFIASGAALAEDSIAALAEYLRRGGGIWLFTGRVGMEDVAVRIDRAVAGGCLPWQPGALRVAPPDRPLRLRGGDWQGRMLRAFDAGQQESAEEIPFLRVRDAGELHPGARLLLAFDDGTPALAARDVEGGGHFVLANFSTDRDAGDLARHGFLVALLHRAVEDLQSTLRRREDHVAGRPLAFVTARPFDTAGTGPRLVGPDGSVLADASLRVNRQDLSVDLPVAASTGFYDVLQGDRLLGRAAVNLDPRESDLGRMEAPRLTATLMKTGVSGVRWYDVRDPSGAGPGWRGTPLWGWAAALGLGLLMVEMALLGAWRR